MQFNNKIKTGNHQGEKVLRIIYNSDIMNDSQYKSGLSSWQPGSASFLPSSVLRDGNLYGIISVTRGPEAYQ
jgi:hypothetical protein